MEIPPRASLLKSESSLFFGILVVEDASEDNGGESGDAESFEG